MMQRKTKPKGFLISGVISALASLAVVAVAPSFAGGPPDGPSQGQVKQEEKAAAPAPAEPAAQSSKQDTGSSSSNGSTDTKGNDRKSGYSDTSSTPQAPNHGKGADNDGDADADRNTGYTEDNDTNDGGTRNNVSDAGDNKHPSGKDRSVESGKSGTQGKAESNPDDSKGPMRYEGTQGDDKANGPGGGDVADQDGNNGCGNDDDFDDDNNGWCGKRVRPATTKPSDTTKPKTCPNGSAMPASGKCDENKGEIVTKPKTCPNGSAMPASGKCDEIAGEVITAPGCPAGARMDINGRCSQARPVLSEDDVLGEQIGNDVASAEPDEGPSVLGVRLSPALSKPLKVVGAVLPFTGGDSVLFLALASALLASGLLIVRSTKRSQ